MKNTNDGDRRWVGSATLFLLVARAAAAQQGQPAPEEGSAVHAAEQSAPDSALESGVTAPGGPAGRLVLFTVAYANDYERDGFFAIPIACVDEAGGFVPEPERCLANWPAPLTLRGALTDERIAPVGGLVDVPDRFSTGLELPGDPEGSLLWASTAERTAPRPFGCSVHRSGPEVAPMPDDALEAAGGLLAEGLTFLSSPWIPETMMEVDLDHDGAPERLMAGSFTVPRAYDEGCFVVVEASETQPNAPTLVDLTCEETVEGTISTRGGRFVLDETSCWDLNSDGVVELWLATGPESMRQREFVEVRNSRLVRVGGSYWFGD